MASIIKNFTSLFMAHIINLCLGFVGVTYLARVLNPTFFGKLSFVMAIISYFTLVGDPGLTTVGVREIARNKKAMKNYLITILPLRVVFTFLAFGFLVIFTINSVVLFENKKLILLYGMILFPSIFLLDWVYKGLENMWPMGIAEIIRSFIYVGSILFLIKGPMDIWKVPIILLVSLLAKVFYLWINLRKINEQKKINILGLIKVSFINKIKIELTNFWLNNNNRRPSLIRSAFPLFISGIAIAIYTQADMVMLGFMRSAEEVGFYAVAYKVQFLLLGFYGIFVSTLYPVVARLLSDNKSNSKAKLILLTKYSFILGIVNFIIVFFGANTIIRLIFGNAYLFSILPLKILIWQILFAYLNIVPALCLLSIQAREYSIGTWIGAIINIILNLFLIPKFGISGAAFATAFSECIILVYMTYKAKKYFIESFVVIELLKTIVIAFGAIVIGIFMHGIDLVNIITVLIVFLTPLILLNVVKKEELKYILKSNVKES